MSIYDRALVSPTPPPWGPGSCIWLHFAIYGPWLYTYICAYIHYKMCILDVWTWILCVWTRILSVWTCLLGV